MNQILLVSYWTDTPYYRECAEKLCKRCGELGIPHHIEQVEDKGNWLANVRYKVDFLLSCLDRFGCPLFYCDVDTEIIQNPIPLLLNGFLDVPFATPLSHNNDWGLMDFCQFINCSVGAYALIHKWRELLSENPQSGTHPILSRIYNGDGYYHGEVWLSEGFSDGTIVKLGVSPK